MTRESLVAALAAALRNLPPPRASALFEADWADIGSEAVSSFAEVLSAASEVKQLWGKWALLPNSEMMLTASAAAIYLSDRCRRGESVPAVVDSLIDFARTGEVDFVSVHALTNVVVDDRVDIGPDVFVAPPLQLPGSLGRYVAFEGGMTTGPGQGVPPGLSALVIRRRFLCLRDSPSMAPAAEGGDDWAAFTATAGRFEELLSKAKLALIAAGGVAPEFGSSYGYASNPGWPYMRESGVGGVVEAGPPPRQISRAQSAAMQAIFDRAEAGSPTLLLAIGRLEASRRRKTVEERAIDLGSCFEILLMHGNSKDNTEIANKISHRGAWLLGATGAERIRISKIIKQCYNLRSTAVHSGKLPAAKAPAAIEKRESDLRDAEAIAERLIGLLIDGWPDSWDDVTLARSDGPA